MSPYDAETFTSCCGCGCQPGSHDSLDAQREACEAYILSQKGAGWTALVDMYDDGGISGGTLERPALQHLLADIVAGRIDTVAAYKIDRLTRSLSDFDKIVDAFDAKAPGMPGTNGTPAKNTVYKVISIS